MTKRFKDIFRNAEVPITLNDLPSDTVSISLVMTNMVNTVFKIEYDPGKIIERTDDTEIMKINDSGSSYIVFDSQTHNKKRIVLEDYSSSYFSGFDNINIETSGKYSFDIIDASSGNTFRNVFTNFVDDVPELVDQRRGVGQSAVCNAEVLIRRLFDTKQNYSAQRIREGGIRFPNTFRQAAERLFRFDAIILSVFFQAGKINHASRYLRSYCAFIISSSCDRYQLFF